MTHHWDGIITYERKARTVYPESEPYNALVYMNHAGVQNIYELWIDKHAEKEEFSDGTSICA